MLGIVYTTIDRDGTMEGPALEQSNRIAEASGLPVVVSGGVGKLSDVERVVRLRHPRVCGLLIGKAIYEGRVDLDELIRRFQSPET
jgi:phosphoribosylformimino-5-aminoimidazole carboxamide ribotide isomerase